MPALAFRSFVFATALVATGVAEAAVIDYQVTNVSGSTWRYDYTVSNNGAITSEIYLFDILFDPVLYDEDSLAVVSDSGLTFSWDQIILASGVGVPAAFDALVDGGGIGTGESISGFAVTFTWLGAGTPGPQGFEIYDPQTFELLGEGTTTVVPLPATAWLFATGMAGAIRRAKRRK